MSKTIYFIRHGQTDYNKLGIVQGSGVDSELNEIGKQQAQAFYDHYQSVDFQLVIASALQRTHQTVEPFIKHKNLPLQKTPLINEINWGIHEGQKYDPSMKESYTSLLGEWDKGNFDASMKGGESAASLSNRLNQFLDDLIVRPEQTVLVCTHGRTLRCMMCLVNNRHLREMENFAHHNTGLYKTHWNQGIFKIELENDITHLSAFESN